MSAASFCGSCGARREGEAAFCTRCGASFADAAARPGALPPAYAPKAGFWVRAVAFVIDSVLISAVLGAVTGALGPALTEELDEAVALAYGLATVAYFAVLWSHVGGGRTLGMRAVRTRVVRTDGSALSLPTALLRYLGLSLGLAVLFLGVIAVGLDPRKQGWHDRMVGTYVLRT